MKRAMTAVLAAGTLAGLTGCSYHFGTKVHEDRVVTLDHVAGQPLSVESANGSVRITKSDNDLIRVDARVYSHSYERIDLTSIVTARRSDGTLFVGVDWPDGKRSGNEGCDFEISIPDATAVSVRTSNDEIILDHIGTTASLITSNDDVVVLGVPGPIDVRTSNDAVKIVGAVHPVDVSTSNDPISVTMAPEAVGPVDLSTSNSDIRLVVGPSFAGTLRAGTSNGRVKIYGDAVREDNASTRATLRFREGGAHSTLSTSNGHVTVDVKD